MSFFLRLLGNAPAVYSLSVPTNQDAFRLTVVVPNERKAHVVGSGRPGDEAGFARWKDFFAAKTAHTRKKVIAKLIAPAGDAECRPDADQSKKERLPVLTDVVLIDR